MVPKESSSAIDRKGAPARPPSRIIKIEPFYLIDYRQDFVLLLRITGPSQLRTN